MAALTPRFDLRLVAWDTLDEYLALRKLHAATLEVRYGDAFYRSLRTSPRALTAIATVPRAFEGGISPPGPATTGRAMDTTLADAVEGVHLLDLPKAPPVREDECAVAFVSVMLDPDRDSRLDAERDPLAAVGRALVGLGAALWEAATAFFGGDDEGAVADEGEDEDREMPFAADEEDTVYVMTLGVLPRFRRLGLARELLKVILAAARNRLGARCARLHCLDSNMAALALYESLGFRRVHKRERYYRLGGRSFDAWELSRLLDDMEMEADAEVEMEADAEEVPPGSAGEARPRDGEGPLGTGSALATASSAER